MSRYRIRFQLPNLSLMQRIMWGMCPYASPYWEEKATTLYYSRVLRTLEMFWFFAFALELKSARVCVCDCDCWGVLSPSIPSVHIHAFLWARYAKSPGCVHVQDELCEQTNLPLFFVLPSVKGSLFFFFISCQLLWSGQCYLIDV